MRPAIAPVGVGDVLADRYRVERVLGTGGMGIVVAAVDTQDGGTVAVKVMMPRAHDANLANLVGRFAREAAAARRLTSDHVAKVTDTGTLPTGAPFLVMEYLRGCDLGTHLKRRGRLPVATAVDVILQACDAIAEAHTFGIIHRDLKPANLFLTMRADGSALVKVLDFGISKSLPSDHTLSSTELVLTGTLTVVGSPHYMAPEQMLSARTVDERADIYALGVNLYLFIAGVHPFQAQTLPELCAQVLREPPRPLWEVSPELPEGLDAVVMKCLAKDPAARYPSITALVRALAPFAATRPPDLTEIVSLPAGFSPAPEEDEEEGEPVVPARPLGAGTGAGTASAELSRTDLVGFDPDSDDPTERPKRAVLAATLAALAEPTARVYTTLRRPPILAATVGGALLIALALVLALGRRQPAPMVPPMVVTPPQAAPAAPAVSPPAPEVANAVAPAPVLAPAKPEPTRTKRRSTAKARTEEDLLRKRR